MIERVKFYCPYCGTEYERSFSVPDSEETKNYICGRYIPHMESIYCGKCEIWFQRGIAILTETYAR